MIKMMIRSPKPTRSPQTFESDHGYLNPPHWSARSKQTIEHMRKNAPNRSISKIFCFQFSPVDFRGGGLKKNQTTAIATPPNGRFIYSIVRKKLIIIKDINSYPKAPSPGELVGKCSTEERSDDRRDTEHA
jgi:hypothetical protein